MLAVAIPPAAADRAPTTAERAAIERVASRLCPAVDDDCAFRRARVSTRNARYAWATVIGEGLSGALLKRPAAGSRRFRVIGVQGGGIATCSYWRKRAPRAVLRDLRISGLVNAETGAVRNCGRRR
jgi:hypothetical protein